MAASARKIHKQRKPRNCHFQRILMTPLQSVTLRSAVMC